MHSPSLQPPALQPSPYQLGKAADEVLASVDKLLPFNPTADPTRFLGTAADCNRTCHSQQPCAAACSRVQPCAAVCNHAQAPSRARHAPFTAAGLTSSRRQALAGMRTYVLAYVRTCLRSYLLTGLLTY